MIKCDKQSQESKKEQRFLDQIRKINNLMAWDQEMIGVDY